MTEEQVLCIPADHVRVVGYFHGLRRADDAYRAAILDPGQYSFRPRSTVETDPAFKQLIPYVVLQCGTGVFHYRRGSGGTEARLRALRSVGIGGHISVDDARGDGDPYRVGMQWELAEEVAIGCGYTERLLGFINDDRTPVGRVHLGVVHVFHLNAPHVEPREDALAGAGFAPWAMLKRRRDEFETWSQFVMDELA